VTRGAIVVDELVIPITDVRLRDGCIHIYGELTGPVPARDVDAYSVHDETGGVIYRVHDKAQGLLWEAVPAGDTLAVIVPISVVDKTAIMEFQ